MRKLIVILCVIFASCGKQNMQGYRIFNLGGSELTITTPEGSHTIQTTQSKFFISDEKDWNKFNYQFKNQDLKVRLSPLATSPEKHINVLSYKHNFGIKVFGASDSVEITINGMYFKGEIPFYYGTDESLSSYNVQSNPKKKNGNVYTAVYYNGICINRFIHIDGQIAYLNDNLN